VVEINTKNLNIGDCSKITLKRITSKDMGIIKAKSIFNFMNV